MNITFFGIRVVSPRKVSRFAPLNRYYIIIDEVFFDNFWEIIYLLVVCKKNKNNSFILVYFKYLFISCTYKKNNNSFILVYFCQRSQVIRSYNYIYWNKLSVIVVLHDYMYINDVFPNFGNIYFIYLVRKDMDVNEHERLSNMTPSHKLK